MLIKKLEIMKITIIKKLVMFIHTSSSFTFDFIDLLDTADLFALDGSLPLTYWTFTPLFFTFSDFFFFFSLYLSVKFIYVIYMLICLFLFYLPNSFFLIYSILSIYFDLWFRQNIRKATNIDPKTLIIRNI